MNKEIVSNNREDEPLIFISNRAINLYNDNKILKAKINKAIEYCNHGIKEYITDDGFVEEVLQDVLDILKGSDSNE